MNLKHRLQNEKKQDGTNRNRLHYKITEKQEKIWKRYWKMNQYENKKKILREEIEKWNNRGVGK